MSRPGAGNLPTLLRLLQDQRSGRDSLPILDADFVLSELAARWGAQLLPHHSELIRSDGNCGLDSVAYLLLSAHDAKSSPLRAIAEAASRQISWGFCRDSLASMLRAQLVAWLRGREEHRVPGRPEITMGSMRHVIGEPWSAMCDRLARTNEELEAVAMQALACLSGRAIVLLVDSLNEPYTLYANDEQVAVVASSDTLLIANWSLSHFVPVVEKSSASAGLDQQLWHNGGRATKHPQPAAAIASAAVSSGSSPASPLLVPPPCSSADPLDRLERAHAVLKAWICAYYADWSQVEPSELPSSVMSAQKEADLTLSAALKRLVAAQDGIRLMVVGTMRAGKSSLLSTLVGEGAYVFPEFAANQSITMVPVEIGRKDSADNYFTVRVEMATLRATRSTQQKEAQQLLQAWSVVVDVDEEDDSSNMEIDDGDEKSSPVAPTMFEGAPNSAQSMLARLLQTRHASSSGAAAAIRPAAVAAPANTPRSNMEEWLQFHRAGPPSVQNHVLKSLYAALDLAGLGPLSASKVDAAHHLVQHLADPIASVLSPDVRVELGCAAVEQLLAADPAADDNSGRVFTFHVATLQEVNSLLFLFAADHALDDLRQSLHDAKWEQLQKALLQSGLNSRAHLEPILPFIVPKPSDAVADLWPLVDRIVVDCPQHIWKLPTRLRLIDTAGMKSARGADGAVQLDLKMIQILDVNRVWLAGVPQAIGGGSFDTTVQDVVHALPTIPVDVIVTKIDLAGLTPQALESSENDVNTLLVQLRPKVPVGAVSRVQGKCINVSTFWHRFQLGAQTTTPALSPSTPVTAVTPQQPGGYSSGYPEMHKHMHALQNDQMEQATEALFRAIEDRFALLHAAANIDKLSGVGGMQLKNELLQLLQNSQAALTHLPELTRRPANEIATLQSRIRDAAMDKDELTRLRAQFSKSVFKMDVFSHLIKWSTDPFGEWSSRLSLSSLVVQTYFIQHRGLQIALDEWLPLMGQERLCDLSVIIAHMEETVGAGLHALRDKLPSLSAQPPAVALYGNLLTAFRLACESFKANNHGVFTDIHESVSITLREHVAELWNDMQAFVQSAIRDKIRRRPLMQQAWIYRGRTNKGVKWRIIDHVAAFMQDQSRASKLARMCAKAFASRVASLETYIASAQAQLVEAVYTRLEERLRNVWQPLPEDLRERAFADLFMIAEAMHDSQPIDEKKLHWVMQREQHTENSFDASTLTPLARLSGNFQQSANWRRDLVHVENASGEKRVLLFRGLCALSTTVKQSFETTDGPFGPLFIAPQHMLHDEWSHLSALAVILYAFRCTEMPEWQDAAQREQLLLSPVAQNRAQLNTLGPNIRAAVQQHVIGPTAAPPPFNHRTEGGLWRNWWSERPTPEQLFAQLYLPFQQLYSNNDKQFMDTFHQTIVKLNLGNTAVQKVINHKTHWRKAAIMTSWKWLSNLLSPSELRMLQQPALHANPNVSMSKQLQHAMRYTVGLKKYAQGTLSATSEPLRYGFDEATRRYVNPRDVERCYRTSRVGAPLGNVVVFAVPESELEQPYVVDVIRQMEAGTLWVDSHVSHESEVCFYGYVPREAHVVTHALVLLDWDTQTLNQLAQMRPEVQLAYERYGFTAANLHEPAVQTNLAKLRQVLRDATTLAHASPLSFESAEVPVREELGTLAFAALRAHLQNSLHFNLGNGFPLERVVKGTTNA